MTFKWTACRRDFHGKRWYILLYTFYHCVAPGRPRPSGISAVDMVNCSLCIKHIYDARNVKPHCGESSVWKSFRKVSMHFSYVLALPIELLKWFTHLIPSPPTQCRRHNTGQHISVAILLQDNSSPAYSGQGQVNAGIKFKTSERCWQS